MTVKRYVSLHCHSIYSNLDGLSKVSDIIDRAVELESPAVCITDHAFATSHFELHELCEKKGIKPIFAVEGYLAPGDNEILSKVDGYKDYYHITMIAKNEVGYKNLMKLIADSFMFGKYRKARTSVDKLQRWNEGVIVLTACLGGYPSQMLSLGRDEEAYSWCRMMKEIFGKDRFFIELTNTNIDIQFEVNRKLVKLAEDLDLDVIITPDSHYTRIEDTEIHRAMVCININRPFVIAEKEKKEGEDVDEGSMFYTPKEYYFKSREELEKYFLEFPKMDEYFDNTLKIADSIDWIKFNKDKKFPCPHEDPDKELMTRIVNGLNSKMEQGILKEEHRNQYINRVKEELAVITKMGFSDYFIEIQNIVKWANENGITTGPGRGCFTAGTMIRTKSGRVAIENVKPETLVYTSDFTLQKVIAATSFIIEEELMSIAYYDELTKKRFRIFCTKDHKFLTVPCGANPVLRLNEKGYPDPLDAIPQMVQAQFLHEEVNFLVGLNHKKNGYYKIKIDDIYPISKRQIKVYDLMVEGNNTFMVEHLFVSNSGAGSFINFVLDITRLNPIDYDLLFSRMLNSGRSALPVLPDILGT